MTRRNVFEQWLQQRDRLNGSDMLRSHRNRHSLSDDVADLFLHQERMGSRLDANTPRWSMSERAALGLDHLVAQTTRGNLVHRFNLQGKRVAPPTLLQRALMIGRRFWR